MKINQNKIGLVHLGEKEKSGLQILEKLHQYNFNVIEWVITSDSNSISNLDEVSIIVVNIGKTNFDYERFLLSLYKNNNRIIINEAKVSNQLSGITRLSWERHLLNKIDSSYNVLPVYTKTNKIEKVNLNKFSVKQVWILAASIGGPEAIQKFLNGFTGKEPVLFIILQHIDKEFLDGMAKQLNHTCQFDIRLPLSGEPIKKAKCLIYPVDEHVSFRNDGKIELLPISKESKYSPCIDDCCKKLSHNLENLNMAVFSGMSTDGINAATYIKKNGGDVITQTEDSCVISSIISGVKKVVDIDFEGTPEELAKYVINKF